MQVAKLWKAQMGKFIYTVEILELKLKLDVVMEGFRAAKRLVEYQAKEVDRLLKLSSRCSLYALPMSLVLNPFFFMAFKATFIPCGVFLKSE